MSAYEKGLLALLAVSLLYNLVQAFIAHQREKDFDDLSERYINAAEISTGNILRAAQEITGFDLPLIRASWEMALKFNDDDVQKALVDFLGSCAGRKQ